MSSDDEREGRMLLRKWTDNSSLIRLSLKYMHVRSARIIRARISKFDEQLDVLALHTEEGDDIKLELSGASFDNVATVAGLIAAGLSPSKYPESLSLSSDMFRCDLFSVPSD
ncbi:MAG: hypothetical protein WBR26_06880 [Candidatus Acidiferrum sp.]